MLLQVEKALAIPPSMQKLMYKGLLKNDTDTLEKVCQAWGGSTAGGGGTVCMLQQLHAISLTVDAMAGAPA